MALCTPVAKPAHTPTLRTMLRPMAIREQIDSRLRQARKDRDEATRNVIGMVKSKVLVLLKSGTGQEENDEVWLGVLTAYAKQLRKAIGEFEKAGSRGDEAKGEAQFELEFCEQFLPTKLDAAQTEALIRKLVTEHSIGSAKMMGKLMGLLMKNHRDELDGGLAKTIADRVLAED